MEWSEYIGTMRIAIERYTERHGEEPNVLYMTAQLMARIQAWLLRCGYAGKDFGYMRGFGMLPSGKIEWFYGLTVKLLDGEGFRWAVAREHVINDAMMKREEKNK